MPVKRVDSVTPHHRCGVGTRQHKPNTHTMKTHVKKGDNVEVIAGKNKGKRGVVLSVNAKKQTVTVEGARILKKATKPTEADPEGGIKEIDGAIHISNVKKVS